MMFFLEKVVSFVSIRVSLVWLCTVVTMTMDSIQGICLLFTNFDHIHLRIEFKGMKAIMLKILGAKSICVKKKKQSGGLCHK